MQEALEFTEIWDIWCIGRQFATLLKGNGYHTAADLVKANDERIRKNMSVVGQRLVNELRGNPYIKWESTQPRKKNIATTRSFGALMTRPESIRQAVSNYTATCAQKLREEKSLARKVLVSLETNVYLMQDQQYQNSITIDLPIATNSTSELIRHATDAFDRIFKLGYSYNKAGVITMDLVPDEQVQLSLFESKDFEKDERIHDVLDGINGQMGKARIRYGAQGFKKAYQMKQDHLSRCYTTRMSDLVVIKH